MDEHNELRGSFYLDLYAREHKRGGAWMDDCVGQMRKLDGSLQKPVAYLTCNFNRPVNGKPALFRLGDTSLSEGLEQQLLGLKEGEKKAFSLEPDAAFGVPSPDLIQYFSRREFIDAGEPELGAIMLFTAMDGSEMPGVIREVNGDSITVDFNHTLAGRTVHFDIEVLEIDPALEE